MYGLFTGKFPFKNENEVKHKPAVFLKRVPEAGLELMSHVFERSEETRYTAVQVLQYPFLVDGAPTPEKPLTVGRSESEAPFTPDMVEFGANVGVRDRRAELVDRLQQVEGVGARKEEPVFNPESLEYTVEDKSSKRTTTFAWKSELLLREMSIMNEMDPVVHQASQCFGTNSTSADLTKVLGEHGIAMDSFGRDSARSFSEYLREIHEGMGMRPERGDFEWVQVHPTGFVHPSGQMQR